MNINHAFVGIAVTNCDAAIAWSQRFFSRTPDAIVTENEAMHHGTARGWIYVIGNIAHTVKP